VGRAADLPQAKAGIKFYVDLYQANHLSPAKYIGQTELGNVGATSGGPNEDFALGKLDMYIDGPWASGTFPANAVGKSNWASFPIPSENGPNPAPVFSGGSDLAVWSGSKFKTAAWNLVQVMDSVPNSTSFANSQGFFPPYTSATQRRHLLEQPAALRLREGGHQQPDRPAQRQNWATADATDLIIPTMMKQLMKGANFDSTVAAANTKLQDVLNNGSQG